MTEQTLIIERRALEPFYKNGYVVASPATRQAAYIDPGDEAIELLEWIQSQDLVLSSILLTHGHMDHICGVGEIKKRWDVPVLLHEEDEFLYNYLKEQGLWFGLHYPPAPPADQYLQPDEPLQLGDLSIRVHHTPGHSPGGVTFEIEEHLFCGDLIFAGGVGRADLPGGSHELLLKTIREKILIFEDEKILHPGHGPDTTVGHERLTNPFLQD
jgi:glyoxylase-like metal-dependent hydrolase (beta-lactamase superfamily II)